MINPGDITTVSVSQLPIAAFNLSDPLPHEVGGILKQGTVQSLADVIGAYLDVSGGVGFKAVQVNDGETLPATTQQEFILVGKGTFINVGGGANITTTEELNALVSNGTYWFIGVEIPINVELAGITQLIRSGFTNTTPSEDAIFSALALKSNVSDPARQLHSFRASGSGQTYTLPSGAIAFKGWINDGVQHKEDPAFTSDLTTFTQSGTTVTFKKAITAGQRIIIDYTL